jgi:hypothetical protein
VYRLSNWERVDGSDWRLAGAGATKTKLPICRHTMRQGEGCGAVAHVCNKTFQNLTRLVNESSLEIVCMAESHSPDLV